MGKDFGNRTPTATGCSSILQRTLIRNAGWNLAGTACSAGLGFFMAPLLIGRLGDAGYGVWILIASITSYFSVLDLGTRGAVGRYVAFYAGKSDVDGVQRTLATAALILSIVGATALAAIIVLSQFFDSWFEVPPVHYRFAWLAFLLAGTDLALSFPLKIFDAALWASQRFDRINQIDIGAGIIRAGLTLWLAHGNYALVWLAAITLGVSLVAQPLKWWLARLEFGAALNIQFSKCSKVLASDLLSYGSWTFICSLAQMATTTLVPVITGAMLTVAAVTPLAIATRLVGYGQMALIAITGVLTPLVARLSSQIDSQSQQRRLYILGTRISLSVAIMFACIFITMGDSLLILWLGGRVPEAKGLLPILALGSILPMSQYTSGSIFLGLAKHKPYAAFRIAEMLLAGVGAVTLIELGTTGVAIAVAIAGTMCAGICSIVYGCIYFGLGPWKYCLEVLWPVLLGAGLPLVALVVAARHLAPTTWLQLIAYTVTYGAVHLIATNIPMIVPLVRRPWNWMGQAKAVIPAQ